MLIQYIKNKELKRIYLNYYYYYYSYYHNYENSILENRECSNRQIFSF
jgi:hypothetical protein